MLRSLKDLQDYAINATDGHVGHVRDFYFDDDAWVIRYLIVDTGSWMSSRKVLISPMSIGHADWAHKVLPVAITKQQVRNSPDIDTDKPVSRQHEMGYLSYYGYENYWGGAGLWGSIPYPSKLMPGYSELVAQFRATRPKAAATPLQDPGAQSPREDPHLRSCEAMIGYHIQATDGVIGHVQGLLVDEQTWAIQYLVVDTNNWWLDHWVLVAPHWIKAMSWSDTTVSLDLTREQVKNAPEYDPSPTSQRPQDLGVYKHAGRPIHWVAEAKVKAKQDAAIVPR
jgi:PRC-barrel domain